MRERKGSGHVVASAGIRKALMCLLVMSVAPGPFLRAQSRGQMSQEATSGPLHLVIETQRASYRVGDSIKVRLTIRNVSDSIVGIPNTTHTIIPLRVFRTDGHEVAPCASPRIVELLHGTLAPLESKGERTYKQNGREWLDLRDWGYVLGAPGSYRISAPASDGVTITITN